MPSGLPDILLYASIPLGLAAAFVALVWLNQYLQRRTLAGHPQYMVWYRLPLLLSLALLLLGLVGTVVYAERVRQNAYAEANGRFVRQAEQLEQHMQSQFTELEHLLNGLRGLFIASEDVSQREFVQYFDARDPLLAYPGFRGLGYVQRVQRGDLPAFVAAVHRDARPDFRVKSSGQAPDLFVIKYLEPASRNQAALGYDLGSEATRRAATESAMRSGRATLSARISLVQDSQQRPAYLFLLPVYNAGAQNLDEDTRVQTLRGWVYSPLVLSELMAGARDLDAQGVNFQLFDGPALDAAALVYDSARPAGEVDSAQSLQSHTRSVFSLVRPVLMGDLVFYLRSHSSPAFEASYNARAHQWVALTGSGLSVLAAMVLWLLLAGRARALELARSMTHELDRLAMVARRSSNAVSFADTEWRINWVNEGFTRMCGYSQHEALGWRPSQLLQSPLADAATGATIDRRVAEDGRVKIQVLQRHKNGRDYWADLEVMAVLGSKGEVTGYLSVQSDVTEEVLAKAALVLEKERADNILSGTNVGTWESNLLTGEQRWNARWSAMMGFTREDISPGADQFWQQHLHPVDRERLNQAMAECIAGRTDGYACDVRVLRKDGSWMWISSRAKVMSRAADGRAEWIGGIHTDITNAKQVELSLRDMEAFLDRAGRIASVGAWQLDFKTREVVFSAQTCAIHGMPADYAPTEQELLDFYPEAERQRVQAAMQQAEQDGSSWDLVAEFRNARQEQLWVRIFGEVSFDDSGPLRLVGAFQDVTRDHQRQVEVERSGTLLRGAIEAINEAFVLYDPQDRLVYCNDKYRAVYARSAELMVPGASFESIIRSGAERGQYLDARGREEAWVAERLAAHRQDHAELEQRLEDGRWLKVIDRRMADGHTVGFRVDITELKLATEAAERIGAQRGEEQKRLQSILEATQVGTWEWNLQSGEAIVSEEYASMLGYTLQELAPMGYATWARLVHTDDLAAAAQLLQEHLRGERPGYDAEVRMQHKQGHWIWVLAKGRVAQRLDDGRPLWIYGTHMDITARKRSEHLLAQTSAMLQNVLDSATAVGVMTMDLDCGLRVFNKGAENLLGYAATELVEQHSVSRFFDPDELGALRDTQELVLGHVPSMAEVMAQLVQTRDAQEWTLVRRDGSRFKASLIFSPMRDAQGGLEGHLAVVYDISKQKEYESSLREAMRLAEQSNVAKSQFLANMSHEIRTPMNAILGMLQLLRTTALNTHQQDYTDKAVGAARSLLGLLNDILDFSKVEADKMQLNPEPFELDSLLGDLSVILSSNLGAKNVDLVFDVDPAIPRALVGDAMRLKQILINLGGNAVKFTERGEVVIRWTLLEHSAERVRVAVAVVDTGIGIAPENQARIFNAFTQAEASTTRRFGGTGLGLVISTRLIRLMGGELQLSSVPGQGSSFSFTLDLLAADLAALPAAPQPTRAAQVHALLVDDNPQALATSAAMMRSLGWEVREAASGEAALDWLKAGLQAAATPVDALFVDAAMPGMDGWETLRNVHRLYGGRKLPLLILLSRQSHDALAERTDREQEMLNGLMVKPLTAPMFARALQQAHSGSPVPALPASALAPGQRLQGMRVLLVEDNLINQQVAQELLQGQGAQVTLADNGALGLEALRRAQPPFDVVLMDLQMPVMDGLSATRLLRADPRFASLPVIAMTANAMQSDRQECLDVGMNDHVGKPFELGQLVQTLITHTGWEVPANAPVAAAPVDASAQPWPEGLDIALALSRMGGNRQLLQRAISAFVDDARQLPARLEQARLAHDLPRQKREWHSFKGLSATIGATALSALAVQCEKRVQDLEPAVAEADTARLVALLAQQLPLLEAVARRLQGDLQHSVAQAADPAPQQEPAFGPAERAQWLVPFRALLQALQACDMEALELYAALCQRLGPAQAQALQALDLAMADLEFERAATECQKLVLLLDPTENPTNP